MRPLLDPVLGNNVTVTLVTWSIILLEIFLFVSLFRPRAQSKVALRLGVSVHIAIAVVQGLVSFSLAMIAALILYLRPTDEEFRCSSLDSAKLFFSRPKLRDK